MLIEKATFSLLMRLIEFKLTEHENILNLKKMNFKTMHQTFKLFNPLFRILENGH